MHASMRVSCHNFRRKEYDHISKRIPLAPTCLARTALSYLIAKVVALGMLACIKARHSAFYTLFPAQSAAFVAVEAHGLTPFLAPVGMIVRIGTAYTVHSVTMLVFFPVFSTYPFHKSARRSTALDSSPCNPCGRANDRYHTGGYVSDHLSSTLS